MERGIIMSQYFNDKYSSIDEFRATAEKVISIKISDRSENKMTLDELWRKIHYAKGVNE